MHWYCNCSTKHYKFFYLNQWTVSGLTGSLGRIAGKTQTRNKLVNVLGTEKSQLNLIRVQSNAYQKIQKKTVRQNGVVLLVII